MRTDRGGRSVAVLLAVVALWGCGGGVQRPDGGEGLLEAGQPAPQLRATDHRGQVVHVHGGEPVVVYFYPKDGTPGCTEEACAFRDAWQRYQQAGLRVVGVSADSAASHREFAEEHDLPFSLIADPEHRWARAFGVGSVLGMQRRVTFLIDAQGRVARVYPDVDPGVHAQQVLEDARQLGVIPGT